MSDLSSSETKREKEREREIPSREIYDARFVHLKGGGRAGEGNTSSSSSSSSSIENSRSINMLPLPLPSCTVISCWQ